MTCTICLRECLNGLGYECGAYNKGGEGENGGNENDHGDAMGGIRGSEDGMRPAWTQDGHSRGARIGRDGNGNRRGQRHKEKICSACCVERGANGDVFCVGCIEEERRMIGGGS